MSEHGAQAVVTYCSCLAMGDVREADDEQQAQHSIHSVAAVLLNCLLNS